MPEIISIFTMILHWRTLENDYLSVYRLQIWMKYNNFITHIVDRTWYPLM